MESIKHIRTPHQPPSITKQIMITLGILLLGIALGWFSKYLDFRQGELPALIQTLDDNLNLHNFLGEFSPWIVLAVYISVYSTTPVQASINVLSFFYWICVCLLLLQLFYSRLPTS